MPGPDLLVNVLESSMGGAIDSGVGLDNKASPRRAAIEKAQTELCQEFDVREERRRELEFLEKGGNPLDFKLGPATSISLQSTSLTDQLAEQHVISEVKGSFAFTTSPHGNSVESSGRPGNLFVNEPNTADNLLLFDNEIDILDAGRSSRRDHVVPSEQSSQMEGTQNTKEGDEHMTLRLGAKSQAYARRNRSISSRECAQSSSGLDLRNAKGFVRETPTDKDHESPNGNVVSDTQASYNQLDMDLDTMPVHETAMELTRVGCPEDKNDTMASEKSHGNEVNQCSQNHILEQDSKAEKFNNLASFGQRKNGLHNVENSNVNHTQNDTKNSQKFVVHTVTRSCNLKGFDLESSSPQITHNLNGTDKEPALVFKKSPLVPDVNEGKESTNSDVQVKIEEETCDSRTELQRELKAITCIEEIKSNDHLLSVYEENLDKLPITLVSSKCELSEAVCSGRQCPTAITTPERVGELSVHNCPPDKRRRTHWDFVLEEMAWLANDFMQERVWKIASAAQIIHYVAFTGRIKFDRENLCQKQRKVASTWANAVMQFWLSAEEMLNCDDLSGGLPGGNISSFLGIQKVDGGECVRDKIEEAKIAQESTKSMEAECMNRSVRVPLHGYAVRFLRYNRSCDLIVQAEAPVTPDRTADAGILEMSWDDQLSEESLFYTTPSGAMAAYRNSVESHWASNEKFGITMGPEDCNTSLLDPASVFGARENAYEEDECEMGFSYLPRAFECRKLSKNALKKKKKVPNPYVPRSYEVKSMVPHGHCPESKFGNQQGMLIGKRSSSSPSAGPIPTKRMRTNARQRVSPFGAGPAGSVHIATKTDVSSGDTSSFHDEQSPLHGGSQARKNMEVDSPGDFGKQLPPDGLEISSKPKKKKSKHLDYRNSTESGGFVISGKGSVYEQRWQLDSTGQHEQRDHLKKRMDNHFESNGSIGLYGQQSTKKPKIMKQLADTSPETITPMTGSIPSPVASPISNLSNPSKFIKLIANRDRSRKGKASKLPAGQLGSGILWSLFEDQALVVLVHDMGPNWELVSDAINTTLQFKCIFHKPKECKERHRFLMDRDRNTGDGADSAEDSGSSQPYRSTLPGIPKGSARQLFQRLQGPMEEDALKSHFEKIILIGEKQCSRRAQNDMQELKQRTQAHSSHALALSQVCPNNLNGGPLTPLDLCDITTSSPDIPYQGSHTPGLPMPNHPGSVSPVQPNAANSMLQVSNNMVLGNSLASPSGAMNTTTREVHKYAVSRPPPSLPIDEQQRMQPYSQIMSARNMQQSGMSVPGGLPVGTDRGVRMLPAGNGMGLMSGMHRGMAIPRPGFQGMGTPGMLGMVSSGSMVSSTGVGLPSPVTMQSGAVAGQGNSMMRPRMNLQMLRPGQNPDDQQRQMMLQEFQMQPGNGQGIAPYNNTLSTPFSSNQTVPPFPVQNQQQHQIPQQSHVLSAPHHSHLQGHSNSPQQQAYLMRIAKERRLHQQRLMHQQQQQHQFPSNPLPPQPQPHSAISSLQNSSQQHVSTPPPNLQHPLTSSPMNHHPVSMQNSQKQHINVLPHASGRGPQTNGALLKQQRQRPQHQLQQPHRHPSPVQQHPRQMLQSQQQQPNKLTKGLGRGGNMIMQQSLPVDTNGGPGPGSQVGEKGEQFMHLMQGQNLYPGMPTGPNSVLPGKQSLVHTGGIGGPQQQKLLARPPPSSKQLPQVSSLQDNNNQGVQVLVPSSQHMPTVVAAQQPAAAPLVSSPSHQQQQQRQSVQSQQTVQRMLQQNRQATPDIPPLPQPSPADQITLHPVNNLHTFPTGSNANMPPCSDSSSTPSATTSVSSAPAIPWKGEPIYDARSPASTAHSNAMGPTQVNSDSSMSPSPGPQRQYSDGMPIHTHNGNRQWQQQQPVVPQQQQQQPQQQHQAAVLGGLYARSSNSGPM